MRTEVTIYLCAAVVATCIAVPLLRAAQARNAVERVTTPAHLSVRPDAGQDVHSVRADLLTHIPDQGDPQ